MHGVPKCTVGITNLCTVDTSHKFLVSTLLCGILLRCSLRQFFHLDFNVAACCCNSDNALQATFHWSIASINGASRILLRVVRQYFYLTTPLSAFPFEARTSDRVMPNFFKFLVSLESWTTTLLGKYSKGMGRPNFSNALPSCNQ